MRSDALRRGVQNPAGSSASFVSVPDDDARVKTQRPSSPVRVSCRLSFEVIWRRRDDGGGIDVNKREGDRGVVMVKSRSRYAETRRRRKGSW